jgi:hypothetical protein
MCSLLYSSLPLPCFVLFFFLRHWLVEIEMTQIADPPFPAAEEPGPIGGTAHCVTSLKINTEMFTGLIEVSDQFVVHLI